jgi:cytochrome c553
MSRSYALALAFLALIGFAPLSALLADSLSDSSDRPWEACGECHGLDGISATAHFPKLAGQKRIYIEKELHDFRSGARANDNGQMAGVAGDFSEQALDQAAVYFSALPAPPPTGDPGQDAVRAKTIVETGLPGLVACHACHGAGAGAAPWLEAQHADYLAKELRDFKSGARANDPTMTEMARRLSDADIDRLAAYLAATRRPAP